MARHFLMTIKEETYDAIDYYEVLFSDTPWICKCRGFTAVGVDPAVMGVGPAVAIPAAVKAAGLQINDIDLFEINEVYFHLVLPLDKSIICWMIFSCPCT
jgi:acetyl-CoA acetyltransferase